MLMSEMSPRNLQLGIFSLLFSGLGLGYSAQEISDKGLLYGYSNAVVCLLLLQSGDKEHRITACHVSAMIFADEHANFTSTCHHVRTPI